ncbi:unnamed protein product [Tetraodon nigroviridis]|uniref:Chromosome undetermined SCAF10674, whole genome shotgun sequence n=1 Tax=Tetraodon nigroviridis TaxID=99883 RepID=Q4T1C3_TETNG|nr:unnamed protein product [Tetraodon nigroviridis]
MATLLATATASSLLPGSAVKDSLLPARVEPVSSTSLLSRNDDTEERGVGKWKKQLGMPGEGDRI